jgi:hypothetical protein
MNILDALYATVHEAPGGCEAVAVRMGMNPGVLRNKANPFCATNKPTLEEANRLMGLTGDYRILQALAGNHGYVCIKMDEGVGASDVGVLELMTRVWSTNGEVGKEVHAALTDGRVTQDEVERIRNVIKEAERALEQVVAGMAGMAEPR